MKTSKLWPQNWPAPCSTHDPKMCCNICHPTMFKTPPEEAKLYATEVKASQILEAKHLYYNTDRSTITDQAYDRLEQSLRDLDPNHPVLHMVGAEPTGD